MGTPADEKGKEVETSYRKPDHVLVGNGRSARRRLTITLSKFEISTPNSTDNQFVSEVIRRKRRILAKRTIQSSALVCEAIGGI